MTAPARGAEEDAGLVVRRQPLQSPLQQQFAAVFTSTSTIVTGLTLLARSLPAFILQPDSGANFALPSCLLLLSALWLAPHGRLGPACSGWCKGSGGPSKGAKNI